MRAGYSIALVALLAVVPAAAQTPAAPRAFPTSDAPFKTRI